VSQPSVFRFEKREQNIGPEVILIDSIAKTWGISVPVGPFDRDDPEITGAVTANLERMKQNAAAGDSVRGIFDGGTKLSYATEWPDFVVQHPGASR
jgi:hypothetical protein